MAQIKRLAVLNQSWKTQGGFATGWEWEEDKGIHSILRRWSSKQEARLIASFNSVSLANCSQDQ